LAEPRGFLDPRIALGLLGLVAGDDADRAAGRPEPATRARARKVEKEV
jgi:hypothetical protein